MLPLPRGVCYKLTQRRRSKLAPKLAIVHARLGFNSLGTRPLSVPTLPLF